MDASELPPPLQHVFREYNENLAAPFVGLTSDGTPRPGLYPIRDTGITNTELVSAASAFIAGLDSDQRDKGVLPVDANEWRAWINAFAPHQPHGILLDDLSSDQQIAAMEVFRAAMSDRGFEEIRKMMKTNAALGEMVGGYHDTLREWMYWFTLFGTPSTTEPWGFQLYGHHCCVNIFVLGGQLTISPMFLGTEPRIVEEGTHAGIRSFDSELELALELMASLSPEQRAAATLSESVQWDDLPPELAHPTEGRMRGSVARDNAVVPLDGIAATELDPSQRERLLALVSHYVGRLPEAHARLKMADVEAHLGETSFAWAGEHDIEKPFYYKVQSPVIFIEMDSHSGIFIGNDDPEPFHIHNIVRTPNGNDYGRAHLAAHAAP
ncbi:DUF3500 domain-containing protein [Rhodococcus sp. NPDC056960]|uniref:DUF3500 domain-containing protein n=1 Tax=Rhodococcus sp. NPDC056960 TaxID=3345982 RepID=UPI00363D732D